MLSSDWYGKWGAGQPQTGYLSFTEAKNAIGSAINTVITNDAMIVSGDFVNSTAAARVNGYAGGHGEPEEITANIESLGLSTAGQKRLLEITNNWKN